ncbi:hypothetical protein QAD02_003929 [Eretmocerus hayati]|uniref:Uncharacterized protein n=1 Tax=Eretmocerus hayati TaxID=131215 RepID=A0ACC2NN34_9HYME|nr:hypothetical protein QAD02_003929 [Eretmocerus hayati]
MPLFDFFRKFLGLGSAPESPQQRFEDDPQPYTDSFRNPIWQNDEDDDDVSDFSGRHPRYRGHFRIFSNPFEITRFFESQMDEMLNNFLGSFDGFGNRFNGNGQVFIPFGNDDLGSPLTLPDNRAIEHGPRDEVLKPSHDFSTQDFTNNSLSPDRNSSGNPCDHVLKPAYQMPDPHRQKLDLDIDGKLKSEELAKIWEAPPSKTDRFTPKFSFRSFGSSVSTQIVRRPDGSVEERRTMRDSDGNEEIRVTRQIGDKMHTIVTKRDKDGSEVKTEDIVNMDEKDLKGFDDRWTKIQVPTTDDDFNGFSWSKFFGPYPKL